SMPDARFAPEGSWRTGYSNLKPYSTIWSSVTVFPWFEGSLRYTRIRNVPGFTGTPDNPNFGAGYGAYKDKAFDLKLGVLPERSWWPALALGMQDFGNGTGIFRAPFGVASKRLGEFDFTAGYGAKRIDGAFGGARWTPGAAPRWSLVAEYDAYDYKKDLGAELSGAAKYDKAAAAGVEYRGDIWGAKAFSSHGNLGVNAYVSLPLDRREWVPKVNEPAPYTRINPRPTEAQWREDPAHRSRMARALIAQDFRDVAIGYENERLEASLTNVRISSMPRAVGRAARTMLSFSPLETREIRITYNQGTLPLATYTFINVPLLQRYFNGMATRQALAEYVAIEYAKPQEANEQKDRAETLEAFEQPLPEGIVLAKNEPDIVAFRGENVAGGRLRVRPGFELYFNDPSGAFRYALAGVADYDRPIARNTFLQAQTRLTLLENISDVTQPSNSVLPHVRTDIADYKRGNRFKLTKLVVNRFYQPQQRVYARASAGVYEEMYDGAGGQALFLPGDGTWAFDVASDWVKQRDFHGWFGVRDYSVLTTIASVNYRMAQGVTATVRAGQFLAKDKGVRGEIKRRFASGWEVGAWYTVTNGKDITSPGSPDHPYYDKGIFMAMPLDTLLTYDTQAQAGFALSPWTRDVGQMVQSPADLYRILERPVVQMHTLDGLQRFGDRDDDYDLPKLGADRVWPDFVFADMGAARREAGGIDWTRSLLGAGALTLGAATLDKRVDREAARHQDSTFVKRAVRVGNALPVAALGLSAMFAFDDSRPQLSDAGVAALEGSAYALAGSTVLKYAVGRARPNAELGASHFRASSEDRYHSFPSRHAAVMWAAVTPYAEEYGMPWLYGVAALASAARVGSREHWLSDTVGGAALGYASGHLAWQARRDARLGKGAPRVAVGPGSVALSWDLP
ncbi:MAG TPA: YjbH domain-containing protein, partial [Burkholderiales bacterium]|nr:YjbH domain-containing protein [Burkholderiales bacterium]